MSKKLFAYLRVSTLKQKEAGTIENQRIKINDFLKINNDFQIIDWFADEGVSAFKERPQFKAMMEKIDEVDGIIITKLDRIARSSKHLAGIIDTLNEKDKQFVVISPNIDTSTPVGKFIGVVLGAVAELEASIIKERMAEGRRRAKLAGVKFGAPSIEFDESELKQMRWYYEKKELGMDTIAKLMSNPERSVSKYTIRNRLRSMSPPIDFRKKKTKGQKYKKN